MKSNKLFYAILFLGLIAMFQTPALVVAQEDDDCCDDMDDACGLFMNEWAKYSRMKDSLNAALVAKNAALDGMLADKNRKQSELDALTSEYNTWLGQDLATFRKNFEEVEKMINSRTGNCEDVKKKLDAITASKARCINEFWDRYNAMVKKYAEWCLGTPTKKCDKEYKVVKGDCLWKIAGRSSIYGNPRLWPKIWDANKNGVISGKPSTIPNPNRIYPGQVLCIPAMTDAEKKMNTNKTKGMMKMRKKSKGDSSFDNNMKKDTKTGEPMKKDEKKDVKKDAPTKDVKKEEKKK